MSVDEALKYVISMGVVAPPMPAPSTAASLPEIEAALGAARRRLPQASPEPAV